MIGGSYLLYYAVDVAGTGQECISVASASGPQGPFTDKSTAPLECQKSLGGSIDPASFIDTSVTPYLVWKSGGPGSFKIWSQQLAPSGTSFVTSTNPTSLLVPDQPWEAGTVETPDLVTTGGHYYLFLSGNDWNSSNYAVGVATCTGPLGPCSDATPSPILSSGGAWGRVRLRRHVREFLDRFPRLGPGRGGVPEQPRPLPPPPHLLRLGAGGRHVRLGQREAASASARRAMPGASMAAHSWANPSVGPRQRNSSTSPRSERSIRNVANSLKRRASC
jgi:hypothetical protein